MNQLRMRLIVVALTVLTVPDHNSNAQTVINGVGSSSGRQFIGSAPIAMCLNQNGIITPKPVKLRSGSGPDDTTSSRITWICNITYGIPGISFSNSPVVIRYAATKSADGWVRLTGQYSSPTTAGYILDVNGCPPQTPIQQTISGLTFDEYSSCTQSNNQSVDFGGTDVLQAFSFNSAQHGPVGTNFPPGGQPVDDSTITTEGVAVLPLAFFVSDNVRTRTGPNATDIGPAVSNLSLDQAIAIFQRALRDWADLGYGVLDTSGTSFDPSSGITICTPEAGSGAKTMFEAVVSNEPPTVNGQPNGTGGTINYSATSVDLVNCLTNPSNNRRAIGYLNAESVVPGFHVVKFMGGEANYPTATTGSPIERKRDIACGRYRFWNKWGINRKITQDSTPRNNLIRVLADAARTRTNLLPSGSHWVSEDEMVVTKNLDSGPVIWKQSGGLVVDHPECRP